MEIIVKTFQQLTIEELYEILKIRCAVFIVEQNCPYQDIDDTDKTALHIFLRDEKGVSLSLSGLYPCGEGAGYAGGIMSAAVDGIKCAHAVLEDER